ncbi:c-type cytochrome [Camelliibacillus cellulosilyticus]|uniref:C-type cytochrome n=1 Tax=Camelliibacillus cellulosilyticus TaxID=2174486 RepID=A0ABV9GNC8_9BACL
MKLKVFLPILAVCFIVVLAACGNSDNKSDKGQSASGPEAVYSQSCASCHGKNLEGKVGPALSHIGKKMSKEQILNQIKNGGGGMPGNLIKGDNAEKVAAWLADKK